MSINVITNRGLKFITSTEVIAPRIKVTEFEINNISHKIKSDIISAYLDNSCGNKRDIIVQKLRDLHLYEDPGDFLEKHNYIHDYIFNYYLYD